MEDDNDIKELAKFLDMAKKYQEVKKILVANPDRVREIIHAAQIAEYIFPYNAVRIREDPMGVGAMILNIEGMDLVIDSEEKQKLFAEMNALADNFEIYPIGIEKLRYAATFYNALEVHFPEGK